MYSNATFKDRYSMCISTAFLLNANILCIFTPKIIENKDKVSFNKVDKKCMFSSYPYIIIYNA